MQAVLSLMALPVLCGIGWRIIRPGGLDAELTRRVLTTLVFNLLLPAMILAVLWQADLGLESLKISLFGFAAVLAGAASVWLVGKVWRIERRRFGAAMLAVAFANVTYLGLPVLEQTFGGWARAIAIQIDLFASMPLVLTLGVGIGRYYGEAPDGGEEPLAQALLKNPPLWAAILATGLNLGGVAFPPGLEQMLEKLAAPSIPLMLIALGLGLRWDSWRLRAVPLLGLVLGLKLAALPWLGVWLGRSLGFSGDTLAALVMEAGMPSMLLGVVLCDRYRLDTAFYAMAVALGTLGALFSLPFWEHRLA